MQEILAIGVTQFIISTMQQHQHSHPKQHLKVGITLIKQPHLPIMIIRALFQEIIQHVSSIQKEQIKPVLSLHMSVTRQETVIQLQ